MPFEDGSFPTDDIIKDFIKISKIAFEKEDVNNNFPCVAVHCIAGLERSPTLVCLGLIEMGMDHNDAISLVTEKIKGAINMKMRDKISEYVRFKNRRFSCCSLY